MKVSLITTLYNEASDISRFLESFKNQTQYPDEFIIVDGGSTDGTDKIIKIFIEENPEINIQLIIDKTCSKKYSEGPISKGRNIAIKKSQNEIIAATDAGCVLHKDWLYEITKPFCNRNVDVVGGWYEPLIETEFQKVYSEIYCRRLEKIDERKFDPSSRSVAFRKKCWEKVGGYHEYIYCAEDSLFDINLRKAGFIFVFTEKALVYWNPPKNLNEAKTKRFNYAYSDGQIRLVFKDYLWNILKLIIPISCIFHRNFGVKKYFRTRYLLTFIEVYAYTKGLIDGVAN